jgi:hypothetical protein
MTILIITGMMAILIILGSRRKHFGAKEYGLVFLVTLLQILYFVYVLLTMEQPPRY